jgi:hypothetical protein
MKMRRWLLALLVAVGLAAVPALQAVSEKTSTDRIDKLIERLGSSKFAERTQASKALDAIGVPALPALRKAAKKGDAETRRQAQKLVARIEQRAETAALLAPTRLHLVCKNMPVTDAVALLAKKSKYVITIDPASKAKLAKRKVTLDTGDVTFWEALDLLCSKAGLAERTAADGPIGMPAPNGKVLPGIRIQPAPAPMPLPIKGKPAKPAQPAQQGQNGVAQPARPVGNGQGVAVAARGVAVVQVQARPPVKGGVGGAPVPAVIVPPGPNGGPLPLPMPFPAHGQIILKDGKPGKMATCYSGVFRIRWQMDSAKNGQAKDRLGIMLDVSAEPKLIGWFLTGSSKIDKALDDQGQSLKVAPPNKPLEGRAKGGFGGIAIGNIARPPMFMPFPGGTNQQSVVVQLELGKKQTRMLKVLQGTLPIRLQTAPEALITVDKVLKATGKTVKGTRGGSIKILKAGKDDNGDYRIQLQLEKPAGVIEGGVGAFAPGGIGIGAPGARGGFAIKAIGNVAVGGPAIGAFPNFVGSGGLSLVDAKGRPFLLVGMSVQANGQGPVEQTLTFRPIQGQTEPARLIFTGRRTVNVDVPFAFKNVKLP